MPANANCSDSQTAQKGDQGGRGKHTRQRLYHLDGIAPQHTVAMIACPGGQQLALACERRLGCQVELSLVFYLRRVASPGGRVKPRRRLRVVLALTAEAVYLLEFRYWLVGMSVGPVISCLPRDRLVACCRRRWWAWPSPWRAELCWPEAALFLAGELADGEDAQKLIGLLTAGEFEQAIKSRAGSP
jgi:hypothetical protein